MLRTLKNSCLALLFAAATLWQVPADAAPSGKPTILLVHGAFAESLSWEGVISRLLARGYPVVAVLAAHVSEELPRPQRPSHDGFRSDAEQAVELLAPEFPVDTRDADGQRAAVVLIELGKTA